MSTADHEASFCCGAGEGFTQAAYDLIVDHPMWIDGQGRGLDYSPEREKRIGDFLDALLPLVRAYGDNRAAAAIAARPSTETEMLRRVLLDHHPVVRSETGPLAGCRCGQVKLGQDVIAHVAAKVVAALPPPQAEEAVRLLDILAEDTDEIPCRYDHHGACQEHGGGSEEPAACADREAHELLKRLGARAVLATPAPVPQGEAQCCCGTLRPGESCPAHPFDPSQYVASPAPASQDSFGMSTPRDPLAPVPQETWTFQTEEVPVPTAFVGRDRYAQCDDTCTADCGACKGAGRLARQGEEGQR